MYPPSRLHTHYSSYYDLIIIFMAIRIVNYILIFYIYLVSQENAELANISYLSI